MATPIFRPGPPQFLFRPHQLPEVLYSPTISQLTESAALIESISIAMFLSEATILTESRVVNFSLSEAIALVDHATFVISLSENESGSLVDSILPNFHLTESGTLSEKIASPAFLIPLAPAGVLILSSNARSLVPTSNTRNALVYNPLGNARTVGAVP